MFNKQYIEQCQKEKNTMQQDIRKLKEDKAKSDAKIDHLEREKAKLRETINSYQDSLDKMTELRDEVCNEWATDQNKWTSQENCYKLKIRMLQNQLQQQGSEREFVRNQNNRQLILNVGQIARLEMVRDDLVKKLNASKRETQKLKKELELTRNAHRSSGQAPSNKRRKIKQNSR